MACVVGVVGVVAVIRKEKRINLYSHMRARQVVVWVLVWVHVGLHGVLAHRPCLLPVPVPYCLFAVLRHRLDSRGRVDHCGSACVTIELDNISNWTCAPVRPIGATLRVPP